MKYQITTTKTGEMVETTMTCEFWDAIIANLVSLEAAGMEWDGWQRAYSYKALSFRAYLKDKTYTLKARQENCETLLNEIALALSEQEAQYLPIAAYFARAQEPAAQRVERLDKLELRLDNLSFTIRDLKRDLDAHQAQQQSTGEWAAKELQEYGEALVDLKEAFSLHREKLFHFMDRRR